jgi:hypothetical protein
MGVPVLLRQLGERTEHRSVPFDRARLPDAPADERVVRNSQTLANGEPSIDVDWRKSANVNRVRHDDAD